MRSINQVKNTDNTAAVFVAPSLSLKNTFFNDFLVCSYQDMDNMFNRTLPMIIKGNKFWPNSVRYL